MTVHVLHQTLLIGLPEFLIGVHEKPVRLPVGTRLGARFVDPLRQSFAALIQGQRALRRLRQRAQPVL
jgi:hypothetical protein